MAMSGWGMDAVQVAILEELPAGKLIATADLRRYDTQSDCRNKR